VAKIKMKDEDINLQLETVAAQVEQQRKDFDEKFEVKRKKLPWAMIWHREC